MSQTTKGITMAVTRPGRGGGVEVASEERKGDSQLSFGRAASLPRLRRDGSKPNVSTLYRWMSPGLLISGRRVRLDAWRAGGRLVTSEAAVDRFLAALNADTDADPATPAVSAAERDRSIAAAERELDAAGVA